MDFLSNVGRRESVTVNEVGRWVELGNKSLNGYERNPLLRNVGEGTGDGAVRFVDAGFVSGADRDEDARAAGVLDVEGDGDLDLIVQNFARPATLLVNQGENVGHWLHVRLRGPNPNMDAVGAKVTARLPDGRQLVREVAVAGGYLAGQSTCLFFGLGEATKVEELEVRWPNGEVTRLREVAADQRLVVRYGAPGL